jgi:cytochrome c
VIGPSFEQVAARYKDISDAEEFLTKRIIDGSNGNWSDQKMPPHPDLNVQDVKEVVSWILRNNSDPDFIYFVGTEGSFRTKVKPEKASDAGVYLLTASYMDHGPKNSANEADSHRRRGRHTIVLRSTE